MTGPTDASQTQRAAEGWAQRAFELVTLVDDPNVSGILRQVADLRGRPIVVTELPGLAGTTVCGWWNRGPDSDDILLAPGLTEQHRDAVVLHEVGHLLLDQAGLVQAGLVQSGSGTARTGAGAAGGAAVGGAVAATSSAGSGAALPVGAAALRAGSAALPVGAAALRRASKARGQFDEASEIAAELLADALARTIRRGPERLSRFLTVFS